MHSSCYKEGGRSKHKTSLLILNLQNILFIFLLHHHHLPDNGLQQHECGKSAIGKQ